MADGLLQEKYGSYYANRPHQYHSYWGDRSWGSRSRTHDTKATSRFDTNKRSELLQNAWRLAYVVSTWMPERARRDAGGAGIPEMSCGEIFDTLTNESKNIDDSMAQMLSKFACDKIITSGAGLLRANMKYLGAGSGVYQALIAARGSDDIGNTTVNGINDLGPNSFFARIRMRILGLEIKEKHLVQAMVAEVTSVESKNDQEKRFDAVSKKPENQRQCAELFDVAELLLAGALLMVKVVDGTNDLINQEFKKAYPSGTSALISAWDIQSDVINKLFRLLGVGMQPPTANSNGLSLRDVKFWEQEKGQFTKELKPTKFLLDAVDALMKHRGKMFVVCTPLAGDTEVYTHGNAVGEVRVILPTSAAWASRDIERNKRISSIPELGAVVDIVTQVTNTAKTQSKKECFDVCKQAVRIAGLPEDDALETCSPMCGEATTPCLRGRYEIADQRSTRQERAQKLAELLANFGKQDVTGCNPEIKGGWPQQACEEFVKSSCQNFDCGVYLSDPSIEEFAKGVCNPESPGGEWNEFVRERDQSKPRENHYNAAAVQEGNAKALQKVAKKRAERRPCEEAINSGSCKDTPLRCFLAAVDSKESVAFPENEYGIVRAACERDVEAIRKLPDVKNMVEQGDKDPCAIIMHARDSLQDNTPAAQILDKLMDQCKDGVNADGPLNKLDANEILLRVKQTYDSAIAYVNQNKHARLPENLSMNDERYENALGRILSYADHYGSSGGNPVRIACMAFEISCMDLERFKDDPRKLLSSSKGRPIHVYMEQIKAKSPHSSTLLQDSIGLAFANIATRFALRVVKVHMDTVQYTNTVFTWINEAFTENFFMGMPRKMTMDKGIVLDNVIRQLEKEREADKEDISDEAVQRVTMEVNRVCISITLLQNLFSFVTSDNRPNLLEEFKQRISNQKGMERMPVINEVLRRRQEAIRQDYQARHEPLVKMILETAWNFDKKSMETAWNVYAKVLIDCHCSHDMISPISADDVKALKTKGINSQMALFCHGYLMLFCLQMTNHSFKSQEPFINLLYSGLKVWFEETRRAITLQIHKVRLDDTASSVQFITEADKVAAPAQHMAIGEAVARTEERQGFLDSMRRKVVQTANSLFAIRSTEESSIAKKAGLHAIAHVAGAALISYLGVPMVYYAIAATGIYVSQPTFATPSSGWSFTNNGDVNPYVDKMEKRPGNGQLLTSLARGQYNARNEQDQKLYVWKIFSLLNPYTSESKTLTDWILDNAEASLLTQETRPARYKSEELIEKIRDIFQGFVGILSVSSLTRGVASAESTRGQTSASLVSNAPSIVQEVQTLSFMTDASAIYEYCIKPESLRPLNLWSQKADAARKIALQSQYSDLRERILNYLKTEYTNTASEAVRDLYNALDLDGSCSLIQVMNMLHGKISRRVLELAKILNSDQFSELKEYYKDNKQSRQDLNTATSLLLTMSTVNIWSWAIWLECAKGRVAVYELLKSLGSHMSDPKKQTGYTESYNSRLQTATHVNSYVKHYFQDDVQSQGAAMQDMPEPPVVSAILPNHDINGGETTRTHIFAFDREKYEWLKDEDYRNLLLAASAMPSVGVSDDNRTMSGCWMSDESRSTLRNTSLAKNYATPIPHVNWMSMFDAPDAQAVSSEEEVSMCTIQAKKAIVNTMIAIGGCHMQSKVTHLLSGTDATPPQSSLLGLAKLAGRLFVATTTVTPRGAIENFDNVYSALHPLNCYITGNNTESTSLPICSLCDLPDGMQATLSLYTVLRPLEAEMLTGVVQPDPVKSA